MSNDVPDQYRPRLCHVVKWQDFQGYGFNLHAEKGKVGQYIGQVDPNSPAEAAGLRSGDRIIEVNDVNIGNENHQQVVTRIKAGGDETRLLVVDVDTDNWYKVEKRIVKGDLPEVLVISAQRDETDHGGPVYDAVDEVHEYSQPVHEEAAPKYSPPPIHNGSGISEDYSHRPRQCHLKIWPDFQGYGFNLHAEKDKPGQYIGLVDDNSPASTGGLRVDDRIIEVNGVNVEQETHIEVIARIKAVPGETKLLVVDKEADNYYKEKNVTVSSSMPQTEFITTPSGIQNGPKSTHKAPEAEHEFTVAPKAHQSSPSSHAAPKTSGDLELNISVAEMKERLKAKKKHDVRQSKISFEDKFKEFQRM